MNLYTKALYAIFSISVGFATRACINRLDTVKRTKKKPKLNK